VSPLKVLIGINASTILMPIMGLIESFYQAVSNIRLSGLIFNELLESAAVGGPQPDS
jgi:hypothetical protein